MFWKKLSHNEIKEIVFDALHKNANYRSQAVLGVPGTYLDSEQFYPDAPFLKDAPYMSVMVNNPNHIGCHTLSEESVLDIFEGTQKIEKELIKICAEQIFHGKENDADGYVAPGGTEANIQAMWVYRNYFMKEFGAKANEIALVYSQDSHYSMPKGGNILSLTSIILEVDEEDRSIKQEDLEAKITQARANGINYFIVVMNLSTTMFGSVDDIDRVASYFDSLGVEFKVHVDGAYGGFIYPFTNPESRFTFKNKYITSFTSDGHKMLQTPYGTGLFLIRKGYMDYVCTDEAQYIPGKDYTICGSRSGANAVSIWMILMTHGSAGWQYKMESLCDRTSRICSKLDELGVKYFRNPHINIITIKSDFVSKQLAEKYHLVADSYEFGAKWWKIVVMPHVKQGHIDSFLMDLEAERKAVAV
ncbi:aspartate aminotransferase family protein [Solitalea longa]|uniref:Aspartate aminotransferase family protein n=1 Tax=Solitalea longa TaxID=2079460 RepID=A0A2S5A4Z3_9SPHI|nr:pyridoxal-dependent decarboxylase [Solitalea longa]POY37594.1 aspartate aminotransferase family protein [Solitalea longa]